MSNPKVIIFGPTGNIGSVASKTAQEHGAKVFLAMRDPSKAIPSLSAEQEKAGVFERTQADLTQPETVEAAVKQAGAKRAFIYLAAQSSDHMKATITALKNGGIEYLVFLSSFTVSDPPKDVKPEDMIGFLHAQVEVNIEQIFGKGNYCAIRPGGFATNSLAWKDGIKSGTLKMHGGNFMIDCITPGDMGRVSGTVLVKGTDEHAVYLYGPQNITSKEAATRIAKALGKDLKIEPQSAQEAEEEMLAAGTPPAFAKYLVKVRDDGGGLERKFYEKGVENVRKYTGRPSVGLEEWVGGNKELFA